MPTAKPTTAESIAHSMTDWTPIEVTILSHDAGEVLPAIRCALSTVGGRVVDLGVEAFCAAFGGERMERARVTVALASEGDLAALRERLDELADLLACEVRVDPRGQAA